MNQLISTSFKNIGESFMHFLIAHPLFCFFMIAVFMIAMLFVYKKWEYKKLAKTASELGLSFSRSIDNKHPSIQEIKARGLQLSYQPKWIIQGNYHGFEVEMHPFYVAKAITGSGSREYVRVRMKIPQGHKLAEQKIHKALTAAINVNVENGWINYERYPMVISTRRFRKILDELIENIEV